MCENLYPALPSIVCKYFEEKLKTAKSYLEFGYFCDEFSL